MMKIEIKDFASKLKQLLVDAKLPASIYTSPSDFFKGRGCPDHPASEESAVVVELEEMAHHRFEVQTGQWLIGEENVGYPRDLRITQHGILGEIEFERNLPITEWFAVNTPSEVLWVIQFLNGKSVPKADNSVPKEHKIEDLLEGIYVPIPANLNLPVSRENEAIWTIADPLKGVITEHLVEKWTWLELYQHKLSLESVAKMLEEEIQLKGLIDLTEAHKLSKQLLADESARVARLKQACLDISSKLTPGQKLKDEEPLQILNVGIEYDFDGRNYDLTLPMKVKLKRVHFGPYFQQEINPEVFQAVSDFIMSSFGTTRVCSPLQQRINLPSLADQKRIVFESARYAHELKRLGQRFDSHPSVNSLPEDGVSHLRRRKLRFFSFSKILAPYPKDDDELLRTTHPLPCFFEAPLIRWERSDESMRLRNAEACFQQFLKISCLLGLEEIHARRNRMDAFVEMTSALSTAIQKRPTLGSWAECLRYLGTISNQLPIWGTWIGILCGEEKAISDLVESRNRVNHSNYPDHSVMAAAESKLVRFFNDLIPRLRIAADGIEIMLPRRREQSRNADLQMVHVCECYELKTASEPFPIISKTLSDHLAKEIDDGIVFCRKDDQVVSLVHFFPVQGTKHGVPEVFAYDKDFKEGQAIVSGVTTGKEAKMPLREGAFLFG